MSVVTHQQDGLFPKPKEIKLSCTCPYSAGLCKHPAAVLYGTGAPSIANWETKGGSLKLQAANLERLQTLAREETTDT